MASPIPTYAAKQNINTYAERVAEHHGLVPGGALEPLIEALGGQLQYGSSPVNTNRRPESMIVKAANDFIIFIPTTTTIERDRFTVAHELGHFFLQYPIVTREHPGELMIATRWVDQNDPVQMRAEWEANWFAAGLLMPFASFSRIWREEDQNIESVASRFVVSVPAANIRASALGQLNRA